MIEAVIWDFGGVITSSPFEAFARFERDLAAGETPTLHIVTDSANSISAYTTGHKFQGLGLGTTWNDPNCRSSFVGHFSY